MSNDTVVKLIQPGILTDRLTEVLRDGARALLTQVGLPTPSARRSPPPPSPTSNSASATGRQVRSTSGRAARRAQGTCPVRQALRR